MFSTNSVDWETFGYYVKKNCIICTPINLCEDELLYPNFDVIYLEKFDIFHEQPLVTKQPQIDILMLFNKLIFILKIKLKSTYC